jgi:hypothetical protein
VTIFVLLGRRRRICVHRRKQAQGSRSRGNVAPRLEGADNASERLVMIIGLSEQAMGIERHISLRLGGFGLVDRPVAAPAAGPPSRPNPARRT